MVRTAEWADLDRVIEIDRSTQYLSHWSPGDYEKYQSRTREDLFHRRLLVALDDLGVVGFVAGTFLEGNEAAVLENLAVDVKSRRRGIARALCVAWIDWAKTKIGYEIPFARHFYTYEPPRPLEEIDADLNRVVGEIMEMLREVEA